MSVYVKPKQVIVAGLRAHIWGKETDTNYCFEFLLKGSSKDRRGRYVKSIGPILIVVLPDRHL